MTIAGTVRATISPDLGSTSGPPTPSSTSVERACSSANRRSSRSTSRTTTRSSRSAIPPKRWTGALPAGFGSYARCGAARSPTSRPPIAGQDAGRPRARFADAPGYRRGSRLRSRLCDRYRVQSSRGSGPRRRAARDPFSRKPSRPRSAPGSTSPAPRPDGRRHRRRDDRSPFLSLSGVVGMHSIKVGGDLLDAAIAAACAPTGSYRPADGPGG